MKQKIKEVQDYFIGKIVAREYEIVEYDTLCLKIVIDQLYSFNLWHFKNGNIRATEFMDLEFTAEQKTIIWENIRQGIKEAELARKRVEFEKLKIELS